MLNTCFRCKTSIALSSKSILTKCSGCKNDFCINCDDLSITLAKIVLKHSRLSWNCVDCMLVKSSDTSTKSLLNSNAEFSTTISTKLDTILADIKIIKSNSESALHIESEVSPSKLNFAQIVKSSLHEDRIDQLAKHKDSVFRSKNHIIHGANIELDANKLVISLLSTQLKSNVKPVSVKRIGKESKLIRITYRNVNDKNLVTSSLKLLKDAPDEFKSISFTNDYTKDEQLVQKNLRNQVKILNSDNPSETHYNAVRYNFESKNFFITKLKKPLKLKTN